MLAKLIFITGVEVNIRLSSGAASGVPVLFGDGVTTVTPGLQLLNHHLDGHHYPRKSCGDKHCGFKLLWYKLVPLIAKVSKSSMNINKIKRPWGKLKVTID